MREQLLAALEDDVLAEADALGYGERFNIAPAQQIRVIRGTVTGPYLALMRWGLVSPWADSPGGSAPLINATSETVSE